MSVPVTCRGIAELPDALLRDLLAAGFVVGPPTPLSASVLDTFDGRLHEAGLRLEHRTDRLVLTGPGAAVASSPSLVAPRFASELPAGPMRARLADITEIRALLPVTTLTATSRRAERRNADDKVVAAVTVHQRLAVSGDAISGWLVGVDVLTGYERQAADTIDLVAPHVGEPEDGDAVDLALAIAGVDRRGRHVDPGIALEPDVPAIEGFRLVLANLAEAIEVNLPGTLDDLDPEFLHDLRVAVRRTRSILRHGRSVLPAAVLAWAEPAMRSLGDLTSRPRDLDVQVIEWDERVAALDGVDARHDLEPLRRQIVADRSTAHDELTRGLGGGDVRQLLDQWTAMLSHPIDPQTGGPHAGDPLGDVVADRIDKAQRTLLDHGRAITPSTPAEHVHDVRKDAKKLRYLLECFAGVLPSDDRKAFVKRLKRLQDLLGAHQDAEVQADSLRTAADELPPTTTPATYLAVGRLIEQLETARQRAREGFADRFAEYDSKPTRAMLREMLAGAES
jgi:CHAD domain-containing protein